jgi:hypothetical protein
MDRQKRFCRIAHHKCLVLLETDPAGLQGIFFKRGRDLDGIKTASVGLKWLAAP